MSVSSAHPVLPTANNAPMALAASSAILEHIWILLAFAISIVQQINMEIILPCFVSAATPAAEVPALVHSVITVCPVQLESY